MPPTSDTSQPVLPNPIKNITMSMELSTGLIREPSPPLKIKDNVDLVGPFPSPETSKEPGSYPKTPYLLFLNNNWLIVPVSSTETWDATEETHTELWDMFKRKV